ncbi:MAG: MBL fold metallo-hydrolase [Sphingomonadales bacterium]
MRLFLFLAFLLFAGLPAQAQEPVYNIENVTGDLYRFQSNNHYGVFLVTEEGIILADPINNATATWLKGELDARFGVPVKYVIYSHDHADHTSGGEVFEDTATFVSHVYAKAKIKKSGHTPVPTKRFPQNYRIFLGGKIVDLFFYGASHSDNLITVHFPEERAVFLVDVVAVKRLPYRNLGDYYFPSAIFYLEAVEEMDFDILIPGHGPIGEKKDVTDHKNYLIELFNQVANAYLTGLSLEETKAKVNLEHYFHWGRYNEWAELNIEGMYRIISELKPTEFPKLSRYINPRYPKNASQARFVGWVILKFDLNEKGLAENITVVDSDAESLNRGITENARAVRQFEKASIKALTKTTYEPGQTLAGLYRWDNFKLPPRPGDFDAFGIFDAVGDINAFNSELAFEDYLANGIGGRTAIGRGQ